ncbi:hypothetical protein C1H46_042756 [Malus baccata]|uniref:Plant heme peroxidase family profile domain-containing protein n=1 Tax=Malus baccata TaxID=106549 RepID=A0A540KBW2_MALBA|nr:hypothetical protein C1H46_042756 [Malus baccata]
MIMSLHFSNLGLVNALKLVQPIIGKRQCPEEGRLPDAGPPSPADHLRQVFYRMGLNDKKDGPGAPGGQSWTAQWLKFDNSYFKDIKEKRDEDLLVLPTDAAIFEDPAFKVYAEKYTEDQEAFFKDYAEGHAKLSNLGAKLDPPEGIVIDDGPLQPIPEKFVAAKYSSGKVVNAERPHLLINNLLINN